MNGNKPDVEKRLYWRKILEEAATSGISMREFCRQRRLKETLSYWWRRMLKSEGQERWIERLVERERGSLPLVSAGVGAMTADLEFVLRDGRWLRIGRGVEEESLRAVLAALEPASHRYRTQIIRRSEC
jgi:transposase